MAALCACRPGGSGGKSGTPQLRMSMAQANATRPACNRDSRSSLARICATCAFTVRSLIAMTVEIERFEAPSARRQKTSNSRWERSETLSRTDAQVRLVR